MSIHTAEELHNHDITIVNFIKIKFTKLSPCPLGKIEIIA